MREATAEAKAIGALIDKAIAQGWPITAKGNETFSTARRWIETINNERGGEIDGKGKGSCM